MLREALRALRECLGSGYVCSLARVENAISFRRSARQHACSLSSKSEESASSSSIFQLSAPNGRNCDAISSPGVTRSMTFHVQRPFFATETRIVGWQMNHSASSTVSRMRRYLRAG